LWDELSSLLKYFPTGCDGGFLFRRELVRLNKSNSREVLDARFDVLAREDNAGAKPVRGAFNHITGFGMD
jgi:hypothetical protein